MPLGKGPGAMALTVMCFEASSLLKKRVGTDIDHT